MIRSVLYQPNLMKPRLKIKSYNERMINHFEIIKKWLTIFERFKKFHGILWSKSEFFLNKNILTTEKNHKKAHGIQINAVSWKHCVKSGVLVYQV